MREQLFISLSLAQWTDEKSWIIPFVGIALITTALMMKLRARRRSGTGRRVSPQEHLEQVRQQKGMRADLEDMMVEIEQLARRFGSQLDAKTLKLEQVIREADERIEQLRRLHDGNPDAVRPEDRTNPQADESVDDDVASRAAPSTPPQEAPVDPLAQKVYQLSDAGQQPADIARQLNEHIGEVELILALRQA